RRHAKIPASELRHGEIEPEAAVHDPVVVAGGQPDVSPDRENRVWRHFHMAGWFGELGAHVVQVEIDSRDIGQNDHGRRQRSAGQRFRRSGNAGGEKQSSEEQTHQAPRGIPEVYNKPGRAALLSTEKKPCASHKRAWCGGWRLRPFAAFARFHSENRRRPALAATMTSN